MIQPKPVEYPTSDGQPMAETEDHADSMIDLIQTIRTWLGDRQRWHVHGNQLFYYVEGNPKACFAPDVYVIEGVPQLPRRPIWRLWQEPRAVPRLVIELTSPSSIRVDLGKKKRIYELIGVKEYIVFDVLRRLAGPPVRVWRRRNDVFEEFDDLRSEVLDVSLRPEDWRLRLVGPDGAAVPSPEERAEAEALRAEILSRRADAEAERADAEAERADAEAERADAEAERAQKLEAQLAKALEELERLKREG